MIMTNYLTKMMKKVFNYKIWMALKVIIKSSSNEKSDTTQ